MFTKFLQNFIKQLSWFRTGLKVQFPSRKFPKNLLARGLKICRLYIVEVYFQIDLEVDFMQSDPLQILRPILSEFKGLINFYSSWNHKISYGFLIISGVIEVK